jgi:hypothetical protein
VIDAKVANVSDAVCAKCPQCWEGRCRAFCLPQSQAEYRQRTNYGQDNGRMSCFALASNASPYEPPPDSADVPLGQAPHTYLKHRPLQEVVDAGSKSSETQDRQVRRQP